MKCDWKLFSTIFLFLTNAIFSCDQLIKLAVFLPPLIDRWNSWSLSLTVIDEYRDVIPRLILKFWKFATFFPDLIDEIRDFCSWTIEEIPHFFPTRNWLNLRFYWTSSMKSSIFCDDGWNTINDLSIDDRLNLAMFLRDCELKIFQRAIDEIRDFFARAIDQIRDF